MSDDQSSLFDQRPGNLEATRGLAEWSIVVCSQRDPYSREGWLISIRTGHAVLTLTTEEARQLAANLTDAVRESEIILRQ